MGPPPRWVVEAAAVDDVIAVYFLSVGGCCPRVAVTFWQLVISLVISLHVDQCCSHCSHCCSHCVCSVQVSIKTTSVGGFTFTVTVSTCTTDGAFCWSCIVVTTTWNS